VTAERITALFLLVRDLARARAFYEALLARAPEKASSSEVRFALPGLTLTLHADLSAAERARWGVPPEEGPRGWGIYVTVATPDVAAAARVAASHGGTVVRPPQEAPWGARICLVRDPDGYWLELTAPHAFTSPAMSTPGSPQA
jgi:predicted enzyme related to lactoylglutathione lyase